MSDFAADVTAWVEQAQSGVDDGLTQLAVAVDARVKELTPVETGLLRASWVIVIGDDQLPKLKDRTPLVSDLTVKAGDKISLVNPVIYARRIEYGFTGVDAIGRHYHTLGKGMMAQTIAELPDLARKVFGT